ncbi:MAG: molecular chaperone DnaK [Patescibacteria group bacterium]
MSIVLGIDLGTTNSAMAYVVSGKPEIIVNSEGARTTPSVFAYNPKDGSVTIGEIAKRNSVLNPENTFYEVKRYIGRSFDEQSTKDDVAASPFKVVNTGGKVKVETTDKKSYSPEEVSAAILRKLKQDAEAKLGQTITEAVITVPAYFNDSQRQATKDAGEIAGLKVLRIVNEPTAAALAYGFENGKDEKVLVYDLGGGTFDVTVLEISSETIEVLSTNGDTHLGGKDFDRLLVDHIFAEFKKETGLDITKDNSAKQRVKEAAEKCKHDLSQKNEYEVNLPFITQVDGQPQHLQLTITRAKFEELAKPLVEKSIEPVRKALSDAKLAKEQINEIIMVGGQTRMPLVQKMVEEFFGKKPNLTVNPDEVVAMGAAIQGAVLKGSVKDILLLDVTPLTLSIETAGGIATPMIERNTTIPATKKQVFSTNTDGQTMVEIHIVQGERPMAIDNRSLGKFELSGIAPAPKGIPQIEVTFDIDANGILKVTAEDKGTNKKADIVITGSSTLSEDEKKKAIEEAERQKDADLAKKAKADARNGADRQISECNAFVKDSGDKIKEEDKQTLESMVAELDAMIKKEDSSVEDLNSKSKELLEKMMEVGKTLYAEAQPQETASSNEEPITAKADDENIQEAEVIENKDKK